MSEMSGMDARAVASAKRWAERLLDVSDGAWRDRLAVHVHNSATEEDVAELNDDRWAERYTQHGTKKIVNPRTGKPKGRRSSKKRKLAATPEQVVEWMTGFLEDEHRDARVDAERLGEVWDGRTSWLTDWMPGWLAEKIESGEISGEELEYEVRYWGALHVAMVGLEKRLVDGEEPSEAEWAEMGRLAVPQLRASHVRQCMCPYSRLLRKVRIMRGHQRRAERLAEDRIRVFPWEGADAGTDGVEGQGG